MGTLKEHKDCGKVLAISLERCKQKVSKQFNYCVKKSNLKVYPFDKGLESVNMKEEDAIKKIDEQIGKSNIIDYDSTTTLLNKFQKELGKVRKEGKFNIKTYYKFYPSDATPVQLYGAIKGHKPQKTIADNNYSNYWNSTFWHTEMFS